MKTCPNCGATNQDAARFCGLCLRTFLPDTDLVPEPAAAGATVSGDYLAPGQVLPVPEPWDSNYLPPAPQSFIEDRRKSILLPAIELLSLAFAFLVKNLKFYFSLSITIALLIGLAFFTIAGPMVSSFVTLLATRQATPQTLASLSPAMITSLFLLGLVVAFLSLLGRLSVMVATVEMSKGFELSAAAAIFEAVKKIPSFLWIAALEAFFIGGITIVGLTLAAATGSTAPLIAGAILGMPVAAIAGTWFSLALFVYLDKGTVGLAALAESKELIGARWPSVSWRYLIFAVLATCVQAIPVLGWTISGLILTPLSAIFPWLLYENLRALEAGAQS